ncbi:MAG: DUF262 domain-containing protein [Alphaproteobacteria bacterium]|nr:DUF262 domain-containing protein [Alphaproteobacteria bacterium]
MQKSSLPVGVKTLLKYYEGNTLDFDSPVQRKSEQWTNLQMSMLIHSMLADFIIPNLYFRKESKDGTNYLSVLDGLQRLSTVFSFIKDEWTTHAKTPKVTLDGVEYDIALKKFSELDEDIKSAILGYRFTTYQLENCTDEEIEETFARLNAGTPLSKIQTARPKMGIELADWCNKLVSADFFQKSLNLTVAQLRHEDDFLMLVTGMMLLDSMYKDGFEIKTSASSAECVRFAESIKNNYPQEKREDMELLVDYLSVAFGGVEYKFLKKNNVPIIMYVAQVAIINGISEEEFLNTVVEFYDNDCTEAYKEASGSGNIKLANIIVRIRELRDYLISCLPKYFEDDDEIPADLIKKVESSSSNGVQDSLPNQENETPSEETTSLDPQDNIVPIPVAVENSEDNTEEPSPIEESGDNVENTEDFEGEESEGEDSEGEDFEGEESEGEDSEGEDFETEDFSLEDTLECVSETEDTGEEHSNTGKEQGA